MTPACPSARTETFPVTRKIVATGGRRLNCGALPPPPRRAMVASSLRQGTVMIHHVSIPAREPQLVATVLAELMNGKCFPFGPLEGAYMAASGDEHGTMIEVYPEQATLEVPR